MQERYTTSHRNSQARKFADVESINILEIADELPEVSPPEQVGEFWARLPATGSKRHAIRAIADEWLTGCYDADDAVAWLHILKLHRCPVTADPYETMATLARQVFGPVALPEPPVDAVRERNKAEGRAA